MVHRGEILKKAVAESGYPISKLAKRLGKSRKWVYLQFENPTVQLDYLLQIGKIIHFDFSKNFLEFSGYNVFEKTRFVSEADNTYLDHDVTYWRNKYIELLEKYNRLLEKTKV
jgi:hypothetical protein